MKTIIIYSTHNGCTEKCAKNLSQKLNGDISVVNLKNVTPKILNDYDTIIIGGSIRAGKIQSKIKKFCLQQAASLKTKRLGLFLCCMEQGDTAQKQFDDAYPEELRQHAMATGLFGGEFNFDKMNFLEKAIIRKVANVTESVSRISEENITEFAQQMN